MDYDALIAELRNIEEEEKFYRNKLKQLRERKRKPREALYAHMSKLKLTEFRGVKVKKVAPAVRQPRKPEAQKKADALELFRGVGIPDPDAFYDAVMKTMKTKT